MCGIMKKLITRLSVLSSLILVGCGGSSDSSTPEPELRSVSISYDVNLFNPITEYMSDDVYLSTQSGYQHRLKVGGYDLCIDDNRGRNCIPNVNLTDENIIVDVKGNAQITIDSYNYSNEANEYTVRGSYDLTEGEESFVMHLENTQWAAITIEKDSVIEAMGTRISVDSEMYTEELLNYGIKYVGNMSNVKTGVLLTWGETLGTEFQPMANKHYAFKVSAVEPIDPPVAPIDPSLGFTFGPVFEDPIEICIGDCPDPIVPIENIITADNFYVTSDSSIAFEGRASQTTVFQSTLEMPIESVSNVTFESNFKGDSYIDLYLDDTFGTQKTVRIYQYTLWSDILVQFANHKIIQKKIQFMDGEATGNFFLQLQVTNADYSSYILSDFTITYK